jgi:undecaprenyl-diphosphatase
MAVVVNNLFDLLKRLVARPRPAGLGGSVDSSYAFPSGHAMTSAAVCGSLAYIFWREGMIRKEIALAVGVIIPFAAGLSRVYLNVHWATDVIGGWAAGFAIAGLSALLYSRTRPQLA